MIADLHTHSKFSDGLLPPAALAALARERGVQLLALTDHDSIDGCEAAREACAQQQIAYVTGAELSSRWRGQTLHVLALGIRPDDASLALHLGDLIERRRARMRTIGERLTRRRGVEIGELANKIAEECAVPTRMHLARALVQAGVCAHAGEAFADLLARGRPGYAPSEWPELGATVNAINAAGGLAVLAHPSRYKLSSGGLRALVGEFAAAGGQGLECSSGPSNPDTVSYLAQLAAGHGLLLSGGSDFHDPANTWNTPGRFAKLPPGGQLLAERLLPSGSH